jgi:hypothetical protein
MRLAPQVEQNQRVRDFELLYAVKLDKLTVGSGIRVPAVKNEPVAWRQIPQWQKCTGKGKLAMGTVKERVEARQWHVAWSVRVVAWRTLLVDIVDIWNARNIVG